MLERHQIPLFVLWELHTPRWLDGLSAVVRFLLWLFFDISGVLR